MTSFLTPTYTLSDSQFELLADFIQNNVGIKMPPEKKVMVQSRLSSRLKILNFKDFDEYLNFVFSKTPQGYEEIVYMIDHITTNLTHFFRENQHFTALSNSILPALVQKGNSKINIWSAGCSTGQEPYTLSIVMQEFMRNNPGKLQNFSILATDISSNVLNKAINAVYPLSEVDELSYEFKKRYFLKSKDTQNPQVRLNKQTRQTVSFSRLNFMDESYTNIGQKEIIFCRNVLIYFDKPTQECVIRKLTNHLVPGGFLFLGHSETIFGMDLPLKTVGPTTFQKI